MADQEVCGDLDNLVKGGQGAFLARWISGRRISALGFSYRLDPGTAIELLASLLDFLAERKLLASKGGTIRLVYFAGLPVACKMAKERFPFIDAVFSGDETTSEVLDKLGIPQRLLSSEMSSEMAYDSMRLQFGEEVVRDRKYLSIGKVDRSDSPGFGGLGEKVQDRVRHGVARGLSPLMRAHVGPFLSDRREAVSLFLDWVKRLASSGLLDVLSIGTSQLTQSNFGESWDGLLNGGGVPINSAEEYGKVWNAARPMLVRTYAGTKDVPALARMHERSLDIAWHALSLWWFCKLDGRGPNTLIDNLREHFDAMRFIASSGKPLEPNVPHHFAFRGSDDLGYIVSGYMAAKAAKRSGVRTLILQIMLNTPKYLWGIQDLAKARALLKLVKSLESPDFSVILQPRGGLDYFSPDPDKARTQLAAVTALMDDIEPHDESSPQIIHVVSYSEAFALADTSVVEESVKLTRHALSEYRRMKLSGDIPDMENDAQTLERERILVSEAKKLILALEKAIPDLYSPEGFHDVFASGALLVPWLTACRDEFPAACSTQVSLVNGGMHAVDETGKTLSVADRLPGILEKLATKRRRIHETSE
jgi:hypothetical protein